MENRFVDSFDLKGALPKAEYMAEKANNKNNSFELTYYNMLAPTVLKMIDETALSGRRSVNICLAEDVAFESCCTINVKRIKKVLKYYERHTNCRFRNNKFFEKLNWQEKAIYHVLMDLLDKDYFISVFNSRRSDGDGSCYDFSYDVPYVTVVW